MPILIGSSAIKHWYPDFPREPNDTDYAISSDENYKSNINVEYLVNDILMQVVNKPILEPQILCTLKASHLFWDTNWDKHMFDFQWLQDKGNTIDEKLFWKLVNYWDEVLPKIRRSNLTMSKEDFFTNAINKDTDEHDFLHTLINPIPMYTKLLKENSEVELDENKWCKLGLEDKFKVIREETYVMAYERYFGKLHYAHGYYRQLRDNIIKHFPRYIGLEAIKNFKLLIRPEFDYYKKITDGINRSKSFTGAI
jgi:hypothetical protein